jgi:hypothetical protein
MEKGAQGGGYVKGGENVSQKEERGKGNNQENNRRSNVLTQTQG